MHKKLLFKFREHLKVLNRSPSTIASYVLYADHFLQDMGVPDVKRITTPMIETWIEGLYDHRNDKGKPYSKGTIALKIRSVKRFFEFLEKTNVIFIDPAHLIKEPVKQKDRIKPALTPKEIKKIFDQPNLGTLSGIRNRTVLELLYSTGIRLGELCALTIYDADLQGRVLRINKGKGCKDRVVPFGKHAARFLREYITKVRPRLAQKNKTCRYLFMDYFGNHLSKQVVAIMIREYRKSAGIKKQVTAHTFRHTFATVLVKNKADILAVQKMMGHTDLKTTQIYIRSLGVDLKKEHKKSHPREKDKEKAVKPKIERLRYFYERRSI